MQTTYAALTESENIVNALRYAVKNGHIKLDMTSFQGFHDNCNCASCRSQRIALKALFSTEKTLVCDDCGIEKSLPVEDTFGDVFCECNGIMR